MVAVPSDVDADGAASLDELNQVAGQLLDALISRSPRHVC